MAILLVLLLVVFTKFLLSPPRPERIYGWIANAMIVVMIPVVIVEAHTMFTIYSDPTILEQFANPTLLLILCVFIDLLVLLFFFKVLKLKRTAGSKYTEQFTGFRKSAKRKLTWPFYLIDPLKRKKPIRFMNPSRRSCVPAIWQTQPTLPFPVVGHSRTRITWVSSPA